MNKIKFSEVIIKYILKDFYLKNKELIRWSWLFQNYGRITKIGMILRLIN